MQLFIKIQNKGEIDPMAFQLVGASTKRDDDSKIGFFGSGNKYAIALLLRKNIFFKIYSGKKEIKFGKKLVNFRDQQYEIITINGKETSLTTDMGPQWEEWFAIREFYCNALDEGEASITVTDEILSEDEKTTIYIEKTEELGRFFSNIKKYILAGKRDYIDMVKTQYSGGVMALPAFDDEFICYRKGIRVNENNASKSLYSYNFEKISINESRMVVSSGDISSRIAQFFAKTTKKEIILNYLNNWKGSYEEYASWVWVDKFSNEWNEILVGKRIYPEKYALKSGDFEGKLQGYIVPNSLAEKIAKLIPNVHVVGLSEGDSYREIDATDIETKKINEAMTGVEKMGYKIAHPIKIGEFYEDDVMACFDKKKNQIVFAKKHLAGQSQKEMESTLLEEYFHSLGYSDASRMFASFLINELISAKKEVCLLSNKN